MNLIAFIALKYVTVIQKERIYWYVHNNKFYCRYLVVEVVPEKHLKLNWYGLKNAIIDTVRKLHGDYGVAATTLGFQSKCLCLFGSSVFTRWYKYVFLFFIILSLLKSLDPDFIYTCFLHYNYWLYGYFLVYCNLNFSRCSQVLQCWNTNSLHKFRQRSSQVDCNGTASHQENIQPASYCSQFAPGCLYETWLPLRKSQYCCRS